MRNRSLIATVALLAAAGCQTPPTPKPDGTSASPTAPAPSIAATATASTQDQPASDTKPDKVTVAPGGDAGPAAVASNAFGMALYQQLRQSEGNLAFSPASISIALAMTYGGAKDKTAEEMRSALRFPDEAKELHGGWATVLSTWSKATKIEIEVANRLFGDKQYTFLPTFLSQTKTRYGAPLQSVDFAGAPQAQRKLINDWVTQKTKKRIEDLIPQTAIDDQTRLVLVNAMYFKGKWKDTFNKDITEPAPFHASGGDVDVPMMRQTAAMGYAEVDGVKLAEKKYEDGDFATLFVLPEKADGLPALEEKLDEKLLDKWVGALNNGRVFMQLPRFEIEPSEPVDLSSHLKKLGMGVAFDRDKADFTGIADPKNPADRLFVGKVFHKAYVGMDEAGTEAAAATAVVMPRAGSAGKPHQFMADRPFLFFVRDTKTNMVLFAGRVADPTK